MRTPAVWDDKDLLEDEPFLTNFRAFALVENNRRKTSIIMKRLEELATGLKSAAAARAWVNLAFVASPMEIRPCQVKLDKKTSLVFVQFYWKLFQDKEDATEDAALFLRHERMKRGFQYELMRNSSATSIATALEPRSSRSLTKKSRCSSHRLIVSSKKQILGSQTQTRSTSRPVVFPKEKLSRNSARCPTQLGRGGFEGNLCLVKQKKSPTSPSASSRPSHSVQLPRRSRRIAAPPVLQTHTVADSTSRPSVSSPLIGSTASLEKAASSQTEGDIAVDVESADRASVHDVSIHLSIPATVLPSTSSAISDTETERRIPLTEYLPNQSERQQISKQYDGCGAAAPNIHLELLSRPSDGTLPLIHAAPCDSCEEQVSTTQTITSPFPAYSGPTVTERLEQFTAAYLDTGHTGIHVAPIIHYPPSCQMYPKNSGEPFSPINDLNTGGFISLGSGELGNTPSCFGEQDQPLHDLEVNSRTKPPLTEYPPIWAQSRQEVCESFDWFRSYQGGVYHVHDFVKGYLLSAFSSSRDIFEHDGRLIISHGGGKAESIHTHLGRSTTQSADDQLAQDKSVRALLANYRESRPLVLLIDDKYALFPYDLGAKEVTYAVLGFYTISQAWAEYQPANNEQGRVVRYKFLFQWCEGQESPWFERVPGDPTPVEWESNSRGNHGLNVPALFVFRRRFD
ncbi:hypothetical protein D9615_004639 [Tricholomella constricta]|uniref:Uncharacterized protein n=1 Tax=Tricholomella constricta TaxID=117010 RepID=A0A8H5HC37_9AGAR|nr:hypothetical protein D9615_004639 [Tricholomella constricta]